MPSTGTIISNTFAAQSGPIPLSQLDANFATAVGASNTLLNFSNYFVDSSGAPNSITITIPAPLVFSYVAGVELIVKIANTNTSQTVNININGLGNKQVFSVDGNVPAIGQFTANSILILFYDGTVFRLLSTSGNTFGIGLFPDGTAGAPSISFLSDPDTGFYRSAPNVLNFSTAGVDRGNLTGAGLAMSVPYLASDGSAASPSVSFISDTNTGFYRISANTFAATCGGIKTCEISETGIGVIAGTAASPSFYFSGDPNTGMWNSAPDYIGFSTNGLTRLEIHETGIFGYTPFKGEDGIVTSPQFTFTADNDTGIWRPAGNTVAISGGGSLLASFGTSSILLGNNSSSVLTLNNLSSATANAGAASLPANPVGFLILVINGTNRKIAYYAS